MADKTDPLAAMRAQFEALGYDGDRMIEKMKDPAWRAAFNAAGDPADIRPPPDRGPLMPDAPDDWTPERERAIRERCEAAPEGPWGVFEQDCLCWITGPTRIIGDEGEMSRSVAAFIAHARTDLPAALREIERLTGKTTTLATELASHAKAATDWRDAAERHLARAEAVERGLAALRAATEGRLPDETLLAMGRAQGVLAAIGDPSARAPVDASRPGLTEIPGVVFDVLDKARAFVEPLAEEEPHDEAGHLAETTCRTCHAQAMLAEIEGAEAECHAAEKQRPGLTEEQAPTPAEMLAACTEEGFGGFGQGFVTGVLAERARLRWLPVVTENQPYIADGKTGNPTEEPCDPESCHGCANEALLRASRGELGPAPSKPAKESDDAPDSGHDDTALTAEQYDRHKARIASGEIPGGAPTTHTVDFGCARPTHAGPEATCSLCHPAPEAP